MGWRQRPWVQPVSLKKKEEEGETQFQEKTIKGL